MKKIPKQNYVILAFITVIIILLVLVLMNVYNHNTKQSYNSVIKDIVNVIKVEDVENYLQENLDVVLYINDSEKTDSKFEQKIRDLITEKNLQQYFVYMERTKSAEQRYNLDNKNPVFVAYKHGVIAEVYSPSNNSINELEAFLIRNEVIEND